MLITGVCLLGLAHPAAPAVAQAPHFRLLEPNSTTELPRVHANDNRESAGVWRDGTLELELDVLWADWRVETSDGPGLRVVALAERGGPPSIPAPLIRVETGTSIRVQIRNSLSDSTVTVFGLQRRPAEVLDSLVIEPGDVQSTTFEAGEAGTYYYWIRLGAGIAPDLGEEEQLAGAFIVDPPGGSLPDRVFVINIFWTPVDSSVHRNGSLEALAINGLSWPYTERLKPGVGDTLRWRIVNASVREHPMHLHGFYYDVTSKGTAHRDHLYSDLERRTVVTETMSPGTTMAMKWIASRPGNWLFHCHLSFHVSPEIRLNAPSATAHGEHDVHMAGLVLGVEVQPGPTDLIFRGDPRQFVLQAREAGADSLLRRGYVLVSEEGIEQSRVASPGPLLVLNQHQPTYATVQNHMSVPTSVHWHGLELDSWSDGVPGWSGSDGRLSPVLYPGDAYTYKLSLMRPGTFIYHSHLDDVHQLAGGLYGVLLVLPPGEAYDSSTDHVYVVGWRNTNPRSMEDLELNGLLEQPDQHATVGEVHRLRLVNIAPAGEISMQMWKDSTVVPIRALAKDGAELPAHQQVEVDVSPRYGVGETADFVFAPTAPGTYELQIGYSPRFSWRQTWIVAPTDSGDGRQPPAFR